MEQKIAVANGEAIKWRAMLAATTAISVVGIAIGFGIPLLSVILESRGFSATAIGVNTAMAGVAALAVSPFGAAIATRFGVVATMMAMLALACVSAVGFYFADSYWMWFPLRLGLHGALTMLFILSEFWIVASAPPERRGLVLGIYATILSLGFALGPWLFSITGSEGFLPFAVIGCLLIAAGLPVWWASDQAPPLTETGKAGGGFIAILFAVPAAMGAVFVFGAVETGGFALLPIYGHDAGHSETNAALLLSMIGLGNMVMQIPIGILADRVSNRPALLAAFAVVGTAGAIALPLIISDWATTALVLFIWGAGVAGLYTVGLTHLSARMAGRDLAAANSAFVFCYSFGMLLGPQFIGVAMDLFGKDGFAYSLAMFFVFYLAVLLPRMVVASRRT